MEAEMNRQELATEGEAEFEAVYALERPVKCPLCSESLSKLNVVRTLRTKVNFTSALPRRGQVMVCSNCGTLVAGSLGGLI